jgi:hypothetical protein
MEKLGQFQTKYDAIFMVLLHHHVEFIHLSSMKIPTGLLIIIFNNIEIPTTITETCMGSQDLICDLGTESILAVMLHHTKDINDIPTVISNSITNKGALKWEIHFGSRV